MQCDAAQLVCGKLSCVRHVGFNSEDARKSWNFPQGEMTGTVQIYARASDERHRMELVLARTSRIRRAQLIFIDHRVVKLWALRTLNTLS